MLFKSLLKTQIKVEECSLHHTLMPWTPQAVSGRLPACISHSTGPVPSAMGQPKGQSQQITLSTGNGNTGNNKCPQILEHESFSS